MKRLLALVSLVVGCAVTTACGSSSDSTPGSGGSDAGPSLSFSPCPLLTSAFNSPPTGPVTTGYAFDGKPSPINEWSSFSGGMAEVDSAMAECATATVPAVWSDPSGDTIEVFVKRYPAPVQPATGQLWLLQGGPGFPGSIFEAPTFLFRQTIPTLDVYMPDHRGTGKSTFAQCPPGTGPAKCAASIPHLDGLTATDAARDLAALIDATRTGSQQVFVHGSSYGTYWAQRYLQIRPDQPTAVILDSPVPVGMDFAEFDENFDDKAHALLALCQKNATCLAKLGPDPIASAKQALSAVATGACKPGIGSIQNYLGELIGDTYLERLLVPASIYRILRCNDADRAWLSKVAAYRAWWNGLFSGFSDVVAYNIISSELWPNNPSYAELVLLEKSMLALSGAVLWWRNVATSWPKYPQDSYYGKWPSTTVPVLILQGGLDPRTPYGDVVQPHYAGANQYYVELPLAGHLPEFPLGSPMADLSAPGCGWQVEQSFLSDPTKPPDTSCIAGMAPLDFGNPPPEWLALVGIQDLWENP